jgi:uncharacterized integral membrane protein
MKVIRAIKYLFLIAVAIALVVLAMANRDLVTLTLLPQELALWSGVDLTIDLPLFVVILGGVATGFLGLRLGMAARASPPRGREDQPARGEEARSARSRPCAARRTRAATRSWRLSRTPKRRADGFAPCPLP